MNKESDISALFDSSPLFPSEEHWLTTLRYHYSEPHRHYHTVSHINSLLDLYNQHSHLLNDPKSVELAVYFHDVMYDPTSTEIGYNERESDKLFKEYATSKSLSDLETSKVSSLILATINHVLPDSADSPSLADMKFFLDIDMAILASDEATYDQYAKDVRREYAHYIDAAYKAGRTKVLQSFLKRDRVYLSDIFKGSGMEEKARENINREIRMLAVEWE